MKKSILSPALVALGLASSVTQAAEPVKPTVVLVHGAFADSSSWDGVIRILQKDGYKVIAAANPLRGVKSDATMVSDLLSTLPSPVVLVGHSYGGSVISEAANGHENVKALVYVAAFAPEAGETAAGLSGKFPGSTLGPALAPPVSTASTCGANASLSSTRSMSFRVRPADFNALRIAGTGPIPKRSGSTPAV